MLLKENRMVLFWSGFFTGIFWFYWVGFSFRYYDLDFVIPLMILFGAFLYGTIFWIIGLFQNPLPRAVLLLLLSFIHPLGFNWFIPEVTLTDSFTGVLKWQFGLFLLSIIFFTELKKYYKILAIIPFLLSLNHPSHLTLPHLKIKLTQPKLSQKIKWDKKYLPDIIKKNLLDIKEAIDEKYDLIILSESIFPLYLDRNPNLMETLKELSKKITIVTGSLSYREGKYYNSTYYFTDTNVTIADKVLLVPFGEEVPLPKFIAKYINDIFFDGASDYSTAENPVDIDIKGYRFRNAICYEATRDELYKNAPSYMIAISNNAWFTPSIEPNLQKLLLKYFSKKYNIVIFHSANMGISKVIMP